MDFVLERYDRNMTNWYLLTGMDWIGIQSCYSTFSNVLFTFVSFTYIFSGAQGQAISKSEITSAADAVLEPLMKLLDVSLSKYAQICDKSVLKRLLKELWKVVIRSLEKNIVLPPVTDRSAALKDFGADLSKSILEKPKKVEDVTGFFKGKFSNKPDVKNVISAVSDVPIIGGDQRSLTPKQCAVMEAALEVIKQYFHAGRVFYTI